MTAEHRIAVLEALVRGEEPPPEPPSEPRPQCGDLYGGAHVSEDGTFSATRCVQSAGHPGDHIWPEPVRQRYHEADEWQRNEIVYRLGDVERMPFVEPEGFVALLAESWANVDPPASSGGVTT